MTAQQLNEQATTKQARREQLAQDLAQTRAHLAEANSALVEGTGSAEGATALKAREMVLAPVLATLNDEIARLEQQVAEAQKSEDVASAKAEHKAAVARLEAESGAVLDEVREFSRRFCELQAGPVEAIRAVQDAENRNFGRVE